MFTSNTKRMFAGLFVLVGVVLTVVGINSVSNFNANQAASQNVLSVQTSSSVSVEVQVPDRSTVKYSQAIEDNQTAIDIMNNLQTNNKDFTFEVQASAYGDYLTTVNGYKASDSKKEFWKVLVNNVDAVEGIDTLKLKNGDVLGFKIDTY